MYNGDDIMGSEFSLKDAPLLSSNNLVLTLFCNHLDHHCEFWRCLVLLLDDQVFFWLHHTVPIHVGLNNPLKVLYTSRVLYSSDTFFHCFLNLGHDHQQHHPSNIAFGSDRAQ